MADREWSENASADNAIATATHAAVTGKQYRITNIQASFSTAPTAPALIQVKDGTTVIWTTYVHNDFSHVFDPPIPGSRGAAVSAELSAGSGASAVAINGDTF